MITVDRAVIDVREPLGLICCGAGRRFRKLGSFGARVSLMAFRRKSNGRGSRRTNPEAQPVNEYSSPLIPVH